MKTLEALLIVGVVFILPLWLFFHYRLKTIAARNRLPEEDLQQLQALSEEAQRLQSRVQALETILNEHAPDWKNKQ